MGDGLFLKEYNGLKGEFLSCIFEIIENDKIYEMEGAEKHGKVDCLDHCLFVSYMSFRVCKRLGLDYRSAARGGLLHDFYLYDKFQKPPRKHRTQHSKIALKNATKYFELSDKEKDIILKHMWPINFRLPRYKESFVVDFMDKYCTYLELTDSEKLEIIEDIKRLISY